MFSLKNIETRENMKKTLIVLFTALLLIATMIVSCTNEAKFDETVQVGFSSASVRGLTASQDIPGSDDLYWFYKASKTPGSEGSQITIGTKTEWTPVKVNAKGLTPEAEGNSGLITLAQGRWDFELQGRIDKDDVNTSVYQGSTSNVLIVKHGEEVNTITVSVSQLATGTGTVKLSNIKVKSDEAHFTDYKPTSYKYRASGSTEWNLVGDADFSRDIEIPLTAATYDFVVMYDKLDGGETIVYASAPITITVTANITTTITGSLDVETTMGQFDVNVVGTKATASFPAGDSENAITVPITPSAEQGAKTTVTFEEGAVSGDTVLVTEVKSIEESMSANFRVTNGSAVAAIDLKITDREGTSKSIAEGKTVTVETYILKGLDDENIQVVYNGTVGAQPTDVTYDPLTGKLTFKTSHFSEFYVVSDAVCYNTDKYVGYPDLNGAVAGASDGDTIVLFNNTSMTFTEGSPCITIDNKDITIDGSGKTVTLSANNANKDQYGIFITGSDSSKTVTIKNATINTEKLERAIRTEGSIGVKIEKCTITTNGVGVHVKGSNKVDIINTQITVNVIDNSTFSAHLRTAVMVGGEDARVTVNGSTINAVNNSKTPKPSDAGNSSWTHSWCKGLYVGTYSKNAKITANDTKVEADFSIAIDGAQNDYTAFEGKPTQIIINSGEYSGLFGSPSGLSYKSLIINGGTFTGISDFKSFNSKDNDVAKLVISGGTFNIEPASKYIDDGYYAELNEDGKYEVKKATNWIQVADTSWYNETESKFTISNARELSGLALLVNEGNNFSGKTIKLVSNIDLLGKTWTPIGAYSGKSFCGIFDGNSKTISNLNIDSAETPYDANGLFGFISKQNTVNSSVKNIIICNANINAVSNGNGGIGVAIGNVFPGCTIDNIKVSESTVVGNRWIGGIVGSGYCTISNCSVENISLTANQDHLTDKWDNGDKVGGIIGYLREMAGDPKLTNCKATDVTIVGYRDLGGIAGLTQSNLASNIVDGSLNIKIQFKENYKNYDRDSITVGEIFGNSAAHYSSDNSTGNTSSATYSIDKTALDN